MWNIRLFPGSGAPQCPFPRAPRAPVPFHRSRPHPGPLRADRRSAACRLGRQCHQDRCAVRGRRGRAARRSAPRLGFSEPASQQAGDDVEFERPEGPRSLQAAGRTRRRRSREFSPRREGKAGKAAIDYESLRRINPRIVSGSISGFGQDGTSVPDSIRSRRAWAG